MEEGNASLHITVTVVWLTSFHSSKRETPEQSRGHHFVEEFSFHFVSFRFVHLFLFLLFHTASNTGRLTYCIDIIMASSSSAAAESLSTSAASSTSSYSMQALIIGVGYSSTFIMRKITSLVAPFLIKEYNITKTSIGLINSNFSFAFGLTKFISGVLTDYVSSKLLLCLGIFLASISSCIFSQVQELAYFSVISAVSGLSNGFIWPAIESLLFMLVPSEKRGSVWSLLAAGANICGMITPWLLPLIVIHGWRPILFYSGVVGVAISLICALLIPNTRNVKGNNNGSQSGKYLSILYNHKIQLLCLCNALTNFVHRTLTDWTTLFCLEYFQISSVASAQVLFWQELGLVIGGLTCGFVTEKFCKNDRVAACFLYTLLLFVPAYTLNIFKSDVHTLMLTICMFLMGASVSGPRTVIALIVRETAPPEIRGFSGGVVGIIGQVGASIGGVGAGYMLQHYQWGAFMPLLVMAYLLQCIILAVIYTKMPTVRTKTD